MKSIRIQVNEDFFDAVLFDTPAGRSVWEAVPFEAKGNLWGEEIYFSLNADVKLENPRETVEEGDLCFWPSGSAFCIFYGPTPASAPGEVRAAGPVEVVGKVEQFEQLKQVTGSPDVKVTPGSHS